MELNFEKQLLSCLDVALEEVQNSEQTQELKLSDAMPDIGQILCAWGQVILRSKEWRGDSIALSGGMMVWVLYAPEDGRPARGLDPWLPIQLRWELPAGTPEGDIRVQCCTRFVDARPVSARKMLIRAGVGAAVTALAPRTVEIFAQEREPEGVELLRRSYPLRLRMEAGEKTFLLDEELSLPDAAPQPERMRCCRREPRITDKKVLSDKVAFRGDAGVHLLYRSEEGQIHSWDFEAPFSQYADLSAEHGPDAQAELLLCPTSLEPELDEEGHLRLKCGLVAQYLITDKQLLTLVEDAYSPGRELEMETVPLELPVVLETRREHFYPEQSIRDEGSAAAEVVFLPDYPRLLRREDQVELTLPGTFHTLYYGEGGVLRASAVRWESSQTFPADAGTQIGALPLPGQAQAVVGSGSIQVKAEQPLDLTVTARQELPMVTGLTLGQRIAPDPGRPSLILCRAGERGLWELAKASGSTVAAIRSANGLSEEPAPDRMLLIPVP